MVAQSIKHEGETAERRFMTLVANCRWSTSRKRGDREVLVDSEWHPVEIKECHSRTVNQVRAIRFMPLVIYNPGLGANWRCPELR